MQFKNTNVLAVLALSVAAAFLSSRTAIAAPGPMLLSPASVGSAAYDFGSIDQGSAAPLLHRFFFYTDSVSFSARADAIIVSKPSAMIQWGDVTDLAFSTDGKYLMAAGIPYDWQSYAASATPSARHHKSVVYWLVPNWHATSHEPTSVYFRDNFPNHLAFVPQSDEVIFSDAKNNGPNTHPRFTERLTAWDLKSWHLATQWTFPNGPVDEIAASPDDTSIAVPSAQAGTLVVYKRSTGAYLFSVNLAAQPGETSSSTNASDCEATYSSDGKLIAVSYGNSILIISVSKQNIIASRQMPDRVRRLRIQSGSKALLVQFGRDLYQMVSFPDLIPVSGVAVCNFGSVSDVRFSPSGKWFCVGCDFVRDQSSSSGPIGQFGIITMVDSSTLHVFGVLGPVSGSIGRLALSADGGWVVSQYEPDGRSQESGGRGLVVFPTMEKGGLSPDAWLSAHVTTPGL